MKEQQINVLSNNLRLDFHCQFETPVMQICFFTDEKASNFLPLTLTRPLDDLRLGILTIREKWEAVLKPTSVSRILENQLKGVFDSDNISEEHCLWLNSRYLPTFDLIQQIKNLEVGDFLFEETILVAALINDKDSLRAFENHVIPNPDTGKTHQLNIEPDSITHFWDLLSHNAKQIKADLAHFNYSPLHKSKFATACISKNPDQIFIADSATIEPGVILIADNGPIFIGSEVTIEAGAILKGPVAICKKSTVKMGAQVFGGSTVGPVCKVAGEINNVIFHSYSNKAHDGFMGNSVIGQWCNFGAGTITSNLKNNYGMVKLPHWETGNTSDEGVQFLGTIMGDHSKTAIGTTLNTGTICGVSSNILNSGFPPKVIRSFSWVSDNGVMEYRFNHAINTMRKMMERRGIELNESYEKMMNSIFSQPNR